MAMCSYGLEDRGLLITPEVAAWIMLYCDKRDGCIPATVQKMVDEGTFAEMLASESKELPDDYSDAALAAECLSDMDIEVTTCSQFDGTACTLTLPEDETRIGCTWSFSDKFLAYIPLQRLPNLFQAAYSSGKEIIKELKDTMGDILPDDFDYQSFLVEISGTYFC